MTNELPTDDLDTQLLAEMRLDFIDESEEHLNVLDRILVQLEQDAGNSEYIEEFFRRIHTIKGTSSFTGLIEINKIAHQMEDILSAVRSGKSAISGPLFNILFDSLSWLRKLRQAAVDKKGAPNIESFLSCLKEAFVHLDGKEAKALPRQPAVVKELSDKPIETIRVRTFALDNILNLVGELIASKNKLNQYTREIEDRTLIDITTSLQRVTGELHRKVVEARLVPINSLFNLFHGTVRNLAVKNQKKVRLSTTGGDTLIDKRLKDVLYDPFVHILRNCLDHGIGSRQEREKNGKKWEGKIEICADRVGDSIEIRVSDDGGGIDPDNIVRKALENGIISKEDVEKLTKNDILDIIFHHGFSTAEKITETSGRGVGMDVVRQSISELRGIIWVESEIGRGTTFFIKIPLSMFLSRSLLLKVSETCIAVPFESIVEIILLPLEEANRIFTKKSDRSIKFNGRKIPFTTLPEILKTASLSLIRFDKEPTRDEDLSIIEDMMGYSRMLPRDEYSPVIIIGLANQMVALLAGNLIGSEELIMKPISDFVGPIKGFSGSALLPNGAIALFLDVRILFKNV